ncbi:hypothetical protein STENM327S_06773 [Streptomyces tendae]
MLVPVYGSSSVIAMTTQSEPDLKRTFRPSRFSRSLRVSQPLRASGTPSAVSIQA